MIKKSICHNVFQLQVNISDQLDQEGALHELSLIKFYKISVPITIKHMTE